MEYNDPKVFVVTGIVFSLAAGFNMPLLGVFLSKFLGYLTAPWEYLKVMDPTWSGSGEEYLEQQVKLYASLMAGVAVWAFVATLF
jgi:hypothetical protein